MTEDIELVLDDALAAGAGIGRLRSGPSFRGSVTVSDREVGKFRARVTAFLREMPEGASVRDLLEVLES